MRSDILTEKLRYYAEHGNIEWERCVEIADAAHAALVDHSNDGEMPQLAAAMVRCCGADEDEAAYFRCAVDSFLQEKWNARPEDSAVFTGLMNMAYQGIWNALRAGKADEDDEPDSPFDDKSDVESRFTQLESFNDLDPSSWTAFDEIKLRTEFHDGLREQRGAALRSLEFEEFAKIANEMDDLRNDQIERLIAEIRKLKQATGSEIESNPNQPGASLSYPHCGVLDDDLASLIERNRDACEGLEFQTASEVQTLIFVHFGRTVLRLANEVAILRAEVKSLKDRDGRQ